MNQAFISRRERLKRNKKQPPLAMLSAILTGCGVTLIGVFYGVEPFVVLTRALVSAVLIGTLVSFGLSVIRVANVNINN